MIPRRRAAIRLADWVEWFRALFSRSAGDDAARFEAAFARFLGVRHARATASGRDALGLLLDAVGCRPGDEVVMPAYTLGELLPVLRVRGIGPVACDIMEDTFNLDPARLAERLTSRTRAVLATHLLGAPCDIERICAVARSRGVAVIEDCAHALGATVGGRPVGTFGDGALFSFEATKAVPTYGGGMVATDREDVARHVDRALSARPRRRGPALRKMALTWVEEAVVRGPAYGALARLLFDERFAPRFERFYRGSHDRLRGAPVAYADFQARLGAKRLAEVGARNDRMDRAWRDLARRLPDGFTPQARDRIGRPAGYAFVALSPVEPGLLRRRMASRGVDIGIRGEVEDDCAALLGARDCPVARRTFERAVLLPLFDGMAERHLDRIAGALARSAAGNDE